MTTEKTEFQVYFDEVLRALGAARTAAVNLARAEYDRGAKDERGDSWELSQVRDLLAVTSLNRPSETAAAVSALLSRDRERGAEHFVHHRTRKDLRLPGEANPVVLCDCGCGRSFSKFDATGRPRRFVSGHNVRHGVGGRWEAL